LYLPLLVSSHILVLQTHLICMEQLLMLMLMCYIYIICQLPGSTDTVSYSTQGINDAVTSALHIILGSYWKGCFLW